MAKNTSLIFTFFIIFFAFDCYADKYPFGRIFTSPSERELLDSSRVENKTSMEQHIVHSSTTRNIQLTETKPVHFSGFLVREDGKSTVWLNGHNANAPKNIQLFKSSKPRKGSSSILVSYKNKLTSLKPGQVWVTDQNKVKEGYEATPASEPKKAKLGENSDTDGNTGD